MRGNLYLRGGGDPTFDTAAARSFARALARTGVTRVTGRVVGDETAFDTLRGGPVVQLHDGLLDRAAERPVLQPRAHERRGSATSSRTRRATSRTPSRARCKRRGIMVGAARGRRPHAVLGGAAALAGPRRTIATLVARTNTPSDNYMAEELLKGLGARFGSAGSTGAGAAVVRSTVAALGAQPALVDGSGLSRRDRTSARTRSSTCSARWTSADSPRPSRPRCRSPGRTGTLYDRLRATSARDRCHAKTGTLLERLRARRLLRRRPTGAASPSRS